MLELGKYKGDHMTIGSLTAPQSADAGFNPLKEATEVQERAVNKLIEDLSEQQQQIQEIQQSKQANSGPQLTGVGTTLDVRA